MRRYFLWILMLVILCSCASKRLTKKAIEFEQAGIYDKAAEYYYEALKRKSSNIDALLGLKQNGQKVLNEKLEKFMAFYQNKTASQATVGIYRDAENYKNRMAQVGVELYIDETYTDYYQEVKTDYLAEKYNEGSNLLDKEQFVEAARIFNDIYRLDKDYKDVSEKLEIARFEPKYREALVDYENEKFRKAYYTFKYIQENTNGYKNASVLMDESREKATITILVTNVKTRQRNYGNTPEQLTAMVKSKINQLDNPFLKIVDHGALDRSIYSMGKIDMNAARLAGIDAVLNGELFYKALASGKPETINKKGYIKDVIKITSKEGTETSKTVYKKTTYKEIKAKNTASLKVKFELIATENNEIIAFINFDDVEKDEIHYAIFDGDKDKLIPGYWIHKTRKMKEDKVLDNKPDVRSLQRLLKGRRNVEPTSKLFQNLMEESVNSIARKIDNYNPEK